MGRKSAAVLFLLAISACVFGLQAVRNVWVSGDRWINSRTPRTFGQSAVHIDGNDSASEQARALSVYYWLQRCNGHGGSANIGPKGSEYTMWDGWNNFHVNPKFWCTLWSSLMGDVWMAYKNDYASPAAKFVHVNNGGHCETALYYADADGVRRGHLFDGLVAFYAYSRDRAHLASVDEVRADFTLLSNPSDTSVRPYFLSATAPTMAAVTACEDWAYVTDDNLTFSFLEYKNQYANTYNTNFYLRKGESLRRQWFNDNKALTDAASGAVYAWNDNHTYRYLNGKPKDPRNYAAMLAYFGTATGQRTWGNGYHVYTPPLAAGRAADGALSCAGLAFGDTGLGEPAVHAAALNADGELVYEIRSIYPFVESFFEGEYLLKSAGTIELSFSIDNGATWCPVVTLSTPGTGRQPFSQEFARTRWNAGQATPFNMSPYAASGSGMPYRGYTYRVKAKIRSTGDIKDVGLMSLTIRNTLQLNLYSLPALMTGINTVTVEGDSLPPDCAVRVHYNWVEFGAVKDHFEYARALPHSYAISVNPNPQHTMADTVSVKCKYLEIAVVDTSDRVKVETSRSAVAEMPLEIFPVPGFAGAPVQIRLSEGTSAPLLIFDLNGRLVRSLPVSGARASWDRKDGRGRPVPPGVYLLRAVMAGKARFAKIVAAE